MELEKGREEMTIHRDMFKSNDGKKPEEPTKHRVYVEFEGGYFVVLGYLDSRFQRMVGNMGRPTKVEFRATDDDWYVGNNTSCKSD